MADLSSLDAQSHCCGLLAGDTLGGPNRAIGIRCLLAAILCSLDLSCDKMGNWILSRGSGAPCVCTLRLKIWLGVLQGNACNHDDGVKPFVKAFEVCSQRFATAGGAFEKQCRQGRALRGLARYRVMRCVSRPLATWAEDKKSISWAPVRAPLDAELAIVGQGYKHRYAKPAVHLFIACRWRHHFRPAAFVCEVPGMLWLMAAS